MKTITKAEYSSLPIKKQRYWEPVYSTQIGIDDPIYYTPVTISLEDAEGVLEAARVKLEKYLQPPGVNNYWTGFVAGIIKGKDALTEALNKMKGV